VQGGFLLDVVITQSAAIFELLSGEDKTLLIRWDSFLVLDLSLDVVDSIGWFDIKGDGLTGESLDEDLHASTKTKDQVQGGFLLDVVITQSAAVFELLSGEDKTLLIRWDSFLVLDLSLDVVDGIGWFDIEGDGLTGESFDENLWNMETLIQFSKEKFKCKQFSC
jgi:hypothetical protein